MTEKIVILDRKNKRLIIKDDDDAYSYSLIVGITHIRKDETMHGNNERIFDIFSRDGSEGFVTNVKEIKEVWGK